MGIEPARQVDPRMYEGCTDGRSLKEVRRVYGLTIPAAAENLRYCEQEDWSGSGGELQFDTSRKGLEEFLDGVGTDLSLQKMEGSSLEREWQKIPRGVQFENGVYLNRIGGCDNEITVDIQELRTDEVRIYLKMSCIS
ncbi:hypothetical protein ACIQNU_40245 [Streptomyces sp. NPDC091292]|uniref:hypothetical protein n=1 Tax=Streptomyces sp. NPDC091292 TaxID=3365991 RepID=UPI003805060C